MARKTTASPKGGKRGCLGKDGKYSPENCTGELQAQGFGADVLQGTAVINHSINQQVITTSRG
ncbi:hypothetical protein EB001_06925 [bacterium]|nr:hypothetical protein [bacterium]